MQAISWSVTIHRDDLPTAIPKKAARAPRQANCMAEVMPVAFTTSRHKWRRYLIL
jgi:hypothetical protein